MGIYSELNYCRDCKHSKLLYGGKESCSENYFCFHPEKTFIDPVVGIKRLPVACSLARMTNGYCSNGQLFEKRIETFEDKNLIWSE